MSLIGGLLGFNIALPWTLFIGSVSGLFVAPLLALRRRHEPEGSHRCRARCLWSVSLAAVVYLLFFVGRDPLAWLSAGFRREFDQAASLYFHEGSLSQTGIIPMNTASTDNSDESATAPEPKMRHYLRGFLVGFAALIALDSPSAGVFRLWLALAQHRRRDRRPPRAYRPVRHAGHLQQDLGARARRL